jgi:hypothetical protein
VKLPSAFRFAVLPVAALALVVLLLGTGGRAAAQHVGRTTQGQAVELKLAGGTLRDLQTRVRLHCTDGGTWDVAWRPGHAAMRLAGHRATIVQVDETQHLTVRLDGDLAGRPHGTLRAIGARDGVRCDSGAVRWAT